MHLILSAGKQATTLGAVKNVRKEYVKSSHTFVKGLFIASSSSLI